MEVSVSFDFSDDNLTWVTDKNKKVVYWVNWVR
jgi:hypothetical protein